MSKVVKIGYAEYRDNDGEFTVLGLVELRVHVYQEDPPDWDLPFWSVWHYYDEEGKEQMKGQFFKDFETAELRFHDRSPLRMFSVGRKCPKCNHVEAMYTYSKSEYRCMSCGLVWHR